ncbi:MAG: C39 family peptidase [Pontiella sp.]|nr:C39 family peptidase [Pontiella sp.]
MKRSILIGAIMVLGAAQAKPRLWTDTRGRSVQAEVVKVNPDRTVVLKTERGKVVEVPFDTFVSEDVKRLETRLALPFDLHRVPWQEMNRLFGIDLWGDPLLWDDPTAAAAERMALKKESKTDFMENHRSYPLGKTNVLSEAVYTIVLYGGTDNVESLSFVFLNQGDMPGLSGYISPGVIEEMAEKIEASGMRVHDALVPVLGKPKRDMLGKGEMREKVYRWDWNRHAIMLSMQEGKYAAMRIMPSERADRAGRVDKIKEGELKKRMAACVERRDNGDVLIRNIPMINQGPKGYCSPATWERYLRYMDIPADMYLLALAGNTGVGGGTYAHQMIDATQSLISSNGRELEPISANLNPESISEHIDAGLPIMWRFLSTPVFQKAANDNTARRNGGKRKKKNDSGQAEDTGSGGHICLIIGYNKQTGEIAISDSWGPRFAERWVKAKDARRVSRGGMNVIKW